MISSHINDHSTFLRIIFHVYPYSYTLIINILFASFMNYGLSSSSLRLRSRLDPPYARQFEFFIQLRLHTRFWIMSEIFMLVEITG